MPVSVEQELRCPCGHELVVPVATSLNASRFPEDRDLVLERRLNRFECPSCHRNLHVDGDVFWFDFHRKEFIGVFPMSRRAHPEDCEATLAATFKRTMQEQAPVSLQQYARGFFVRTVFGVEELREKLVLHEAGLDDFLVEALKAELLRSHRELVERGVVTVQLDSFLEDGSLVFVPEAQDGTLAGSPPVLIGARREVYDAMVPHRDELLRERGAIVNGSHVSLRRIADAMLRR